MKKTININLGGLVFAIDEDAYERLHTYIEQLKVKFTDIDERNEIIEDIEYRFAELFGAQINQQKEVVSLAMVNEAIATMGEPEEIEDDSETANTFAQTTTQQKTKKLFRNPDDKIFAGVLSGVSSYFGIQDAIWLRIIMVLLTFASIGIPTVLIYIVLWIVMPEAKTATDKLQMKGEPINLDNIEDQVKKKYLNADEVKKTSVRVANKASELIPIILKVVAIGLVLFFAMQLLATSIFFLAGGFVTYGFNSDYVGLLFESRFAYFLALFSLYVLVSVPLVVSLYLGIKLLLRKKVNWVKTFSIALLVFLFSLVGVLYSGYDVAKQFTEKSETTQYVALENPAVEELSILFPYGKLKRDLKFRVHFGKKGTGFHFSTKKKDDDNISIEGIEVLPNQINLNAVCLNIEPTIATDSIFKLQKTTWSRGRNQAEAEKNREKIQHDFTLVDENTISIPKALYAKDERKWRAQGLSYTLYVPMGKKVYFDENASKVISDVIFNGEYTKKDLAYNTWQMTPNGLQCVTCEGE